MDKETLALGKSALQSGIILGDDQLAQFDAYRTELLKWNEKMNLVSEKSSHDIVRRHFQDSLTALPFIENHDAGMVDIGCGAGFPGIPLKIATPSLSLYLLETNRKKVSFLKHVIRLLNLADTYVLHERIENILKIAKWNNFFDILISRAAFKLPEILLFGAFFLKPGGKLIALKSKDVAREFLQGMETAPRHGFSQLFQYDINQEDSDITRKIIIGEKTR